MTRPSSPLRHALLAVLALSLLLSACAPSRVAVLVLWHPFSGVRERALLDLVDQWNQRRVSAGAASDIVVAQRMDVATMRTRMIDGKARGAGPALFIAPPALTALLHRNGLARELDGFVREPADAGGFSDADRADLFDLVFSAGRTPEGKTIGLGFGGAVRALYFNRDWLRSEGADSAPIDMDQLATLCGRASDPLRGTQCLIAAADATTFQDWLYLFNGTLSTERAYAPQFTSPAAISATTRLAIFSGAGLLRRAVSPEQPRQEFAAGRSLFSLDWSDQFGLYRTQVRDNADFAWGIVTPPANVGNVSRIAYQGWLLSITPGGDAREREAWQFMQWMLAEPQTTQWAAVTRELPARASSFDRLRTQGGLDIQSATVLLRLARIAQPPPAVVGWSCAEIALTEAIADVFDGLPAADALKIAQDTAVSRAGADCIAQRGP